MHASNGFLVRLPGVDGLHLLPEGLDLVVRHREVGLGVARLVVDEPFGQRRAIVVERPS